ncbi:hypothetical protein FRB90_010078, partial [Tulasnella sp. 427]
MSNGMLRPHIRLNTDIRRSDQPRTPPSDPTAYSPWSPLSPSNLSIPNSPFSPEESVIQPGVPHPAAPPLQGTLTIVERVRNGVASALDQGVWNRSTTDLAPVAIRQIRSYSLRKEVVEQ